MIGQDDDHRQSIYLCSVICVDRYEKKGRTASPQKGYLFAGTCGASVNKGGGGEAPNGTNAESGWQAAGILTGTVITV